MGSGKEEVGPRTLRDRFAALAYAFRRWRRLNHRVGNLEQWVTEVLTERIKTPAVLTRKILLCDEEDRVRGSLHINDGQPCFTLCDEEKSPRCIVRLDEHGAPEIRLLDGNGHSRIIIKLEVDGTPLLGVSDPDGRSRVMVDDQAVAVCDDTGARIGLAMSPDDGVPGLVIRDRECNIKTILGLEPNGGSCGDLVD